MNMTIKTFNVSLESDVVLEARKKLVVGQALSPVINDLLKKWIKQQEVKNDSR